MNRKQFMQMVALEFVVPLSEGRVKPNEKAGDKDPMDYVIRVGERMWERLSERGYGEAKARKAGPNVSHYRSMTDAQREGFDRFWKAFGHNHGKEDAVRAWVAIAGVPDDAELVNEIVAAAGMDKQYHDKHHEKTRMWAQGWLNHRRWEDYEPKKAHVDAKGNEDRLARTHALSEARALQTMGADKPGHALHGQWLEYMEKAGELPPE